MTGDIFPTDKNEEDVGLGFGWKKYYRNPRNYFVLPKKANYIDMEILVEVFKGNMINIGKKHIENIDYCKKD